MIHGVKCGIRSWKAGSSFSPISSLQAECHLCRKDLVSSLAKPGDENNGSPSQAQSESSG